MAGEIQAAFDAVYADGPTSAPTHPPKPEIRNIVGATIQSAFDDLLSLASGSEQWKTPVTLATTANITLSGEQTIDGVLTSSTAVLVKNQSTGAQNGIYTTGAGAWTRRSDANEAAELVGMAVFVRSGTANGGKQFVCTTPAPIVVGTTALTFMEISDQSALNATLAGKADQTEVDALEDRLDETVLDVMNKEPRRDGFSSNYEWAFLNNGRVAAGKHVDSIAPFLGVGLGSLPLQGFSADWALAVYDEATGAVLFGVRADGTFYPEISGGGGGGETPGMTLSVSGSAPNRQISATIDGTACLLAKGGGDYYSATLSGWDASWTAVMASGTFVARARMQTATLVEQDNIVMIPAYGQSLSTGRTNGTVADGSEVAPGKVYMYPPGIRVFGVDQKLPAMAKRLDRRKLDGFVPAKETASGNGGSTGWAVMGKRLTDEDAIFENSAVLVATAGLGGASYNTIKKGTKYFDDYTQIVQQAKFLADYQGKGFTIPFAVLVNGEANRANDQSTFMGYLNEFQSDQSTLFKSITGQSAEVVLVTSQLSSWTAGSEDGIATSEVPLAQLQVALDDPTKHRCAGPKYQFDYVDGLHLTAESYDDHGDMVARAINTPGWLPLHPVGATIDGAVITVEFHVPQGNLALDTSLVTNPGSYGVEFFQTGGSPVTISSVTVASSTTLEITLSATPTGTDQKVGFGLTGTPNTNGGPSTGPRTCIRDSSTDVSARGNPMYNWSCHSIIDMGTVPGFLMTFDSGGEEFISTFDDTEDEENIAIGD